MHKSQENHSQIVPKSDRTAEITSIPKNIYY